MAKKNIDTKPFEGSTEVQKGVHLSKGLSALRYRVTGKSVKREPSKRAMGRK